MSQENAVKDVNFDDVPKTTKKINYKEVFISLNEGDNLLRIVDIAGKKIGTHWIKDVNGKQRSVKCPIVGCPCCKAIPSIPIQYKTFLKVVDKLGNIRILEAGPQIVKGIRAIVVELKQENPNILITQRDIIINRGPKGSQPLYNVKLAKVNPKPTPSEQLRQGAIEEAISKDELNLAEIVVPWTVKRINEYIYGCNEDGSPLNGEAPKNEAAVDTSFNFGANAPDAPDGPEEKSDEDMSMFD